MADIKPGLIGDASQIVTEATTAAAYGSGFVPAFATPAMIALMEGVSANAIQPFLAAGQTSVGVEVNVKHLAATPIGMTVRARAELLAVDGRRMTFKVEAWDDKEKIGEGTHVRAVIDEARFKERLAAKK
jgi:fluoroacetyl-CoA thioesterase